MELREAVLARRSVRAYRPDPVPATVLRELVDAARWTPSAANTQPWEFTIVGGETLQTLRSRLRAEAARDQVGKPEMGWPPNLAERFKARRAEIGTLTMQALGVAGSDQGKKDEWFRFGIGFFDAPHVIVLTMERCFSELGILDLGAVAVTLQLLAHSRGLGTCPQAAPLRYPWVFNEVLGIPENKRILLALPIGYPKTDAAVNHFRRPRLSTGDILQWAGTAPPA